MSLSSKTRFPWATFSLATIIAIVSIVAFDDLDNAIDHFGLIPDQVWRYGGLTLFTSFFIHVKVTHLIYNLYLLILLGMPLENHLGWKRWLLLVFIAAFSGDLLHVFIFPHDQVSCVGASGGISGLIAFYALKSPYARLRILFTDFSFLKRLQIPAWLVFMLWMLLQFWGLYKQSTGPYHVVVSAHLGGIAAGVLLWMMWNKLNLSQPQTLQH